MGTTQTRIDDPSRFLEATADHVNHKISAILRDNRVIFGTLANRAADALYLKDMRGQTIRVPLESINEIFLDSNF